MPLKIDSNLFVRKPPPPIKEISNNTIRLFFHVNVVRDIIKAVNTRKAANKPKIGVIE